MIVETSCSDCGEGKKLFWNAVDWVMCISCPLHRWVSVVCFTFHEYEKILFPVHILWVYVVNADLKPYCTVTQKMPELLSMTGSGLQGWEYKKHSIVSVYFPSVSKWGYQCHFWLCFLHAFFFSPFFPLLVCVLVSWFVNTQWVHKLIWSTFLQQRKGLLLLTFD